MGLILNPKTHFNEIRKALLLRRGGLATPWNWSPSFSSFTLRVEHPRLAGNIHIRCIACERVEFNSRILDCNIDISRTETGLYEIRDGLRLFIECGLLSLEFNVMPLFGIGSENSATDGAFNPDGIASHPEHWS
jgi:hypothetical protein